MLEKSHHHGANSRPSELNFDEMEIGRRGFMGITLAAAGSLLFGCDSEQKAPAKAANAITPATSIDEALALTAAEVRNIYALYFKNGGVSNPEANERVRRTYENFAQRLGNLIPNLPTDFSTPEKQNEFTKALLPHGYLFYFGAYQNKNKWRMSGYIAKVEDYTWPFEAPAVSFGSRPMSPPPDLQTKNIAAWFTKPIEHSTVRQGNLQTEVIAPGGCLNEFHLIIIDPVDLKKYREMHHLTPENALRVILCNELGNSVFNYYLEGIPNIREYVLPMQMPQSNEVTEFTPQDASEAFSDYVSMKYGNEFWGLLNRASQGNKGSTYELTQFVFLVAFGTLANEWGGKPAIIPKEQIPAVRGNAEYMDFVSRYISQDVTLTTTARDRVLEIYELILGKFFEQLDPLREKK